MDQKYGLGPFQAMVALLVYVIVEAYFSTEFMI